MIRPDGKRTQRHTTCLLPTHPWPTLVATLLACIATPLAATPLEKLPEGLHLASVEITPEAVELSHPFDYRQLLVTGRLAGGERVDLTRMITIEGEPVVVSISDEGLIAPRKDGQETIKITVAGHKLEIPVTVRGTAEPRSVSFVQDVQPILSRLGCNAGTCHGAKDGKNGFKLSLRGYDALFDHRALTDDRAARRFNRVAPDESLMLLKATGRVPHVGGVRTQQSHAHYEMLRRWIAQGARFDGQAARVERIDVQPHDPVLPRPGLRQQMVVWATYADGTRRDVTREAFVESGDIEILAAEEGGLLRLLRRGEAPVLVRYEGAYAATTLTVMGDRTGFVWHDQPQYNFIDQHVDAKLRRVKILPSPVCRDEEFMRRVYIDLTGLLPSPDEVRDFLADARPSRVKREELVDRLIGSPEYVEYWTNKWADLLQVNRRYLGPEGAAIFRDWIQHSVAVNKPYDEFVREVLTASGSTRDNPPAAYYKIHRDPAETMENTTQLFLATRFNCNKCHDHPFERWTQDQYYQLSAYFAQVGRKADPIFAGKKIGGTAVAGAAPLVEIIYDRPNGSIKHERTGETAAPHFPYFHADQPDGPSTLRRQLAHWITSPENPYFARSYVNRLWGYLFGRGIIDPIDDIRAGNPPTNPALLDALTREFVDSGFDVQHLLRLLCTSRTYQHGFQTNRWNEDDRINYSHALPRRLPAEVLFDAVHRATGSTPRLPGMPPGFRAAQITDSGIAVPFLDDFGRPPRESSCECERSGGMMLGPVMKLVNGPTIAKAIADPNNALKQLAESEHSDERLADEMFLRFLSRFPTDEERHVVVSTLRETTRAAETAVGEADSAVDPKSLRRQALEDLAWALINSPAFLFNH